jgi:hypothetical protein
LTDDSTILPSKALDFFFSFLDDFLSLHSSGDGVSDLSLSPPSSTPFCPPELSALIPSSFNSPNRDATT